MTYAEALYEERKAALSEGEARGEARGRIKDIRRIMQKLNMSIEEAMDFLEISITDRPKILAAL